MQQIRVKTDSLLNIPIMNTKPMEIIEYYWKLKAAD